MKKIKDWIINKLDSEYRRELDIKHQIIDIEIKRQKLLTEELQQISITDAIRKRYKSIRPLIAIKELDNLSGDERESHIANCYSLTSNETLQYLMDVICHNLIDGMATKVKTMEEMFFNRASLNGIYLLEETIALLGGEYEESRKGETDQDDEELTGAI